MLPPIYRETPYDCTRRPYESPINSRPHRRQWRRPWRNEESSSAARATLSSNRVVTSDNPRASPIEHHRTGAKPQPEAGRVKSSSRRPTRSQRGAAVGSRTAPLRRTPHAPLSMSPWSTSKLPEPYDTGSPAVDGPDLGLQPDSHSQQHRRRSSSPGSADIASSNDHKLSISWS